MAKEGAMRNLGCAFTLGVAILGMHAGTASGARWTEISTGLTGPVAGARSLVIDRTGSTLYVVTSGSAVFKSADGGASWKVLGGVTAVQVLALDPASASTIYAGTARGVFKSTNGGESWEFAGLAGRAVITLAVDSIRPSTLYAGASDDHVYKSTDAGGSWITFSVGVPADPYHGVSRIVVDPVISSTLYVIGGDFGSALYKSTDGAETWSVVNPGPVFRLLAISPSALYAIVGQDGFCKSTDGGATWIAAGLPMKDVAALAIDPKNSNTLYASTSAPVGTPPSMYKSTDGGHNWNELKANIPLALSFVLNPANPSIIYAANYQSGVFKSTDAGASWSESNTGARVPGIRVLVGDPMDRGTVYAGGDGGLFKSIDGGNWSRQAAFQVAAGMPPPGLPLPATPIPSAALASVQSLLIDFTNPGILYAGTHRTDGCFFSDSPLFKSTDDGASWSDSLTPKDGFGSGCMADGLMAMDPADPSTIYLRWGFFLDGFSLRKSTDGGASWDYTGLSADALYILAIDPTNPTTLYAGTNSGVSMTTDGGATWKIAGLANTNVTLLAIDPVQPNVLYAGTIGVYPDTSRSLFKSSDSGMNWSPINNGLGDVLDRRTPVNVLIIDPHHTDVLYVGTSGYGVFRSSDGGATWVPFNDGLTNLDVGVLTIVGRAVYAGTPGGVFRIVEDED
jgi:photosystem II stability/assembly factor-like uncharacterized protein